MSIIYIKSQNTGQYILSEFINNPICDAYLGGWFTRLGSLKSWCRGRLVRGFRRSELRVVLDPPETSVQWTKADHVSGNNSLIVFGILPSNWSYPETPISCPLIFSCPNHEGFGAIHLIARIPFVFFKINSFSERYFRI